MQNDDWHEYAASYKPLIDTNRTRLPLSKYPKNLDFTKTIGGTTYLVKSHFNPSANESLLRIIMRRIEDSGKTIGSSL